MTRSPIQQQFAEAARAAGILFLEEVQVSRYRADFVLTGANVIIEVDGHEYHKSAEDRTYDARRDRALQREGFTVLRFTGTEVANRLGTCIEEIKQFLALQEPQPEAVGAMYIDWLYFDRTATRAMRRYRKDYPNKSFDEIRFSDFLAFTARYLNLQGRHDIHLFGAASSFSTANVVLDTLKLKNLQQCSLVITEHQEEFVACALVDHLHTKGSSYEQIVLLADDSAYPPLLDRGRQNGCAYLQRL